MIDITNFKSINDFEWNYTKIDSKLEEFVTNSKQYLKRNILED